MGKGFVIYLLSCIITLAFGLIFSNVFILFLFFVFLLAPVFSKIMMKLDAKNMKIKIYCAGDSVQENETLLYLDIISKNKLIYAQGMLYLTLEITYHKYGETRKRHMKVPVSKRQGTIKITTLPDLCSGISVKCISVYSEDMLGIIRTDMTPPPPFYFTAFPKQLQVSIAGISQSRISSYNDASQMSKKGSDYTEVREFKDYIPGDSVKAIHWKLSSKLDRTLIKVGSDSTSLKTLIFLNIERASDESDPDENKLLCALLQLGFTVSTGLIENGVSHKICSVTDSGLELYNVLNYEDEITAQKEILASPVPVGSAGGVKRLLFEKSIYNYSKIICICREGNADEARRIGWILFFATASLIFAVAITGTHAQVTQNMKQLQRQVISNVRFGDDSLPEGDLSKASDMLNGSDERLIVTSEYGRDLYLRGFVGAKYENGKWQELKNSAYGSGNSSIINWLNDRDFTAQYQYNSYIKNNEKSFDSNNITIENVGAQRNYIYLPYSAAPFSKGSTYIAGDLNTKSSAFFGASSYDFCEQSDIKPTELYTLESWYSSPETEQEKEYKESETVYRKFVYENYLFVDEKDKDEINTLFWSKADKKEKENLLSAIEHIRDMLEESCEYNESCDYVKQSDEPLSDFLFTYQVGNSCLFASAAVEALRCAGFPARYAEGYLLQNSEKLEETVTLTTDDAHAWAEVYMDGVGWLPVDFTPGFYYDTYALVSLVDAPNESKAVSNNPNGDSGSHNFSTDKTNIKKRKTEKAKKHDIYILIGILTALVLLIFAALSVIKIQKIIRVSKLRRAIEKAEPKKPPV